MNVIDLIAMGIEVQISYDEKFEKNDVTIFRFRKGTEYIYRRIVLNQDIIKDEQGSAALENVLCTKAADYFDGKKEWPPYRFGTSAPHIFIDDFWNPDRRGG